MGLTERDADLLTTLCVRVRLMTLPQIAGLWWPESADERVPAERLGKLAAAELVHPRSLLTAPLPTLDAPVLSWHPETPDPDCGAVAWQLQSRWVDAPQPTPVYLATRQAAKRFGGRATGRLKASFQATHDLGVAEIYLHCRRHRPELAERWIGEDRLAPYRRGQKLPDAVVAERPDRRPELVLEFGGAYDKRRVQSFHNDCKGRQLPYEVW